MIKKNRFNTLGSVMVSVIIYVLPFLASAALFIGLVDGSLTVRSFVERADAVFWISLAFFVTAFILITAFFRVLRLHKKIYDALDKTYLSESKSELRIRDEISMTAEAFVNYALQADDEIEGVSRNLSVYEKMVPFEIMRLLDKDGMEDIAVGEHITVTASVLRFSAANRADRLKPEDESHSKEERLFYELNKIVSPALNEITNIGGSVHRFENDGLLCFHINDYAQVLTAAINISNEMRNIDGDASRSSIGISYGSLVFGIIGNGFRMSHVAISEQIGFADFLTEIGGKYGAKILVSSSFSNLIEDFHTDYESRMIGYVYLESSGEACRFYDVFEADDPKTKKIKRKTKLIFEQGVNLFTRRKFEEARLLFVEVLKINRLDSAATRYLDLCDKFISFGNRDNDMDIYIELY